MAGTLHHLLPTFALVQLALCNMWKNTTVADAIVTDGIVTLTSSLSLPTASSLNTEVYVAANWAAMYFL